MRLPPVRTTWLAAIVAIIAAVTLTASLAVTHGAVRSEQRQRAALAAVSDFNALLSKMDAMGVGRAAVEEAQIVNWLNVFQGRPGLESSVADACSGRVINYGVRWLEAPGDRTAGFRPLSEAKARSMDQLGPNVFIMTLPAGTLCPDRSLEVVAVRDTVGPMRVVMGRVVEPTGRAWGVAAVTVAGMAVLLVGLGLASAAWSRARMVSGVRRINLSLQKAGRGDFGGPIPLHEMTGELQDLTREVNVTLGRLQELLAWLRDTSDQVAHDFRTPLARARARLDRFGETGEADLVDEARADLRYLTQAMNEALALRDGETWAYETVKLDDICRAAVEMYEPLAQPRRIRFETELTPTETLGVASLLQRALANLVDNAVKYSPDGGVVRLKTYSDPQGAVVIIGDQGPGMEMTQSRMQPDIDSHRMGLAFVRAIVRRHGGELEIESDSSGSTITMRV